jgi:hypothetical protein
MCVYVHTCIYMYVHNIQSTTLMKTAVPVVASRLKEKERLWTLYTYTHVDVHTRKRGSGTQNMALARLFACNLLPGSAPTCKHRPLIIYYVAFMHHLRLLARFSYVAEILKQQ